MNEYYNAERQLQDFLPCCIYLAETGQNLSCTSYSAPISSVTFATTPIDGSKDEEYDDGKRTRNPGESQGEWVGSLDADLSIRLGCHERQLVSLKSQQMKST